MAGPSLLKDPRPVLRTEKTSASWHLWVFKKLKLKPQYQTSRLNHRFMEKQGNWDLRLTDQRVQWTNSVNGKLSGTNGLISSTTKLEGKKILMGGESIDVKRIKNYINELQCVDLLWIQIKAIYKQNRIFMIIMRQLEIWGSGRVGEMS